MKRKKCIKGNRKRSTHGRKTRAAARYYLCKNYFTAGLLGLYSSDTWGM